jgi:hypothetical protein
MLLVVDFNGKVHAQYDYRETLGVVFISDLSLLSVSARQFAARRANGSVFLAVRRSSGKPPMQTSSRT